MCNGHKQNQFAEIRRQMADELAARGITDSGVLKAMAEIAREQFVLDSYRTQAYADGPLPIGMGQTISQPYIVALMTQELRLNPGCEVLEIGTGSGYQTAILARLAKKVYTIEKHNQLSESAQAVLGRLGFDNIKFCIEDGSCGWPDLPIYSAGRGKFSELIKFDRIIITAAVPKIPEPIADQLAEGGLMVAPVGGQELQKLVVCEKHKHKIIEKEICDVRFVKLVGKYGFEK
ncbi:MAG: protein-L-isoaspartate(D-aspartate) O-methyltransferase [Planctomycetes bacterium]|nr:protein-L-isoaspartate(D-aspartate) O-methyltransferase [Planctomycetota bacterium]